MPQCTLISLSALEITAEDFQILSLLLFHNIFLKCSLEQKKKKKKQKCLVHFVYFNKKKKCEKKIHFEIIIRMVHFNPILRVIALRKHFESILSLAYFVPIIKKIILLMKSKKLF